MLSLKNIHKYDKEKLTHKPINKKRVFFGLFIVSLTFFGLGFVFGYDLYDKEQKNFEQSDVITREDLNPTKNKLWLDSTFKDYEERARLYLSRPIFEGTPLNGEMMSLCARNAYDSTGILVPVELALSQAQWESSMGREGRSPVNNPFNIGEHDSGTVLWFESTFDGVQSYYYWMSRTYLKCRSLERLLLNFVNCDGKRYAIKGYEENVSKQYRVIKNWLSEQL
jgi:hypothetical protein